MNHSEIIARFAKRQPNKSHYGEVYWKGSRVYCKDRVLYSHGDHFPLAVYLGEKDGQKLFLKNADRYSASTSKHQSITQEHCPGPSISFTALGSAAPFYVNKLTTENVVSWEKETHIDIWLNEKGGKFFSDEECTVPFVQPKQGMAMFYGKSEEYPKLGYWHILAGVVLKIKGRQLLGCLDERQYCLIELPSPVENVTEAFTLLKPEGVQLAEAQGQKIVRQGEWFFADTEFTDKQLAAWLGMKITHLRRDSKLSALPYREESSHRHECRHIVYGQEIYATGNVYHRDRRGEATGEHATTHLGETWWRVYKNTEVQSWTASGKFD